MITRLLIANRGEIAVRIARTALQLGIYCVGVHSTADKRAFHTRVMDESHLLGGPLPADSYLNVAAIIAVAHATGCDAIHPGYGFLSENPQFAAACEDAGIVFVGPPASAMKQMAVKGVARTIMEQAGVPVLPGLPGLRELDADALSGIRQIGYPLLIKPEAGGGGKGMYVVQDEAELGDRFEAAQREALASFGNDQILLERYLTGPRHVEVQVFADAHGHCIHLNERDCSLQRRHQKVIEESPAPHVTPQLREALGAAAVDAAQAIGYVGAGTVEFLLDSENRFYFMEMNTRLQVEHPVTEMVTGLDLVAWQLRIAGGDPLPITQAEVPLRGHAFEARIYAEDPAANFLPDSGVVTHLQLPGQYDSGGKSHPEGLSTSVRVDSGVEQGDVVGVFYDPMLMKVIAHAGSRAAALAGLQNALAELQIAGLTTNRDFLLSMCALEEMQAGRITTNYLDNRSPHQASTSGLPVALCCAVAHLMESAIAPGFRLNQPQRCKLHFFVGEETLIVTVTIGAADYHVHIGDQTETYRVARRASSWTVVVNGIVLQADVVQDGGRMSVFLPEDSITFSTAREYDSAAVHGRQTGAPMSGRIIRLLAEPGDPVTEGAGLVVLEAMKMEHTVRAPGDGQVTAFLCAPGDLVDEGFELFEFESDETTTAG